jgi:hypothetical protein
MRNQPAYNHHEFHRRRAEVEMEKALAAAKLSIAVRHLELAKLHREKRNLLVAEDRARLSPDQPRPFHRTDKEA